MWIVSAKLETRIACYSIEIQSTQAREQAAPLGARLIDVGPHCQAGVLHSSFFESKDRVWRTPISSSNGGSIDDQNP